MEWHYEENVQEARAQMKKLERKYKRQRERKRKIFEFFMRVISMPLCIVFRTIAFGAKIVGVIASFALFSAMYKGYILFTEHDAMAAAAIWSEIVEIAKMVVAPFLAYLVARISDEIQQYFYLYTY